MEKKEKSFSIMKQLLGIGVIILVLQIPLIKLSELLSERQMSQEAARALTARTHGASQIISGPIIQLPYLINSDETPTAVPTKLYTYISPDKLKIDAKIQNEIRHRGIYRIPTYTADLDLSGSFSIEQLNMSELKNANFLWDEAKLTIGVSEPKSIKEQLFFEWNQNSLEFKPGSNAIGIEKGIHVSLSGLSADAKQIQNFNAKLKIGGTDGLYFKIATKSTEVSLIGDWSNPSFVGSYAPVTRETSGDQFSAVWKVSNLALSSETIDDPQQNTEKNQACIFDDRHCDTEISATSFGLRLLTSVDTYRMIHRAQKYKLLIVVLTFITFFMFELIQGLRLHPINYFLVGVSLVSFYLLLLSLAEHIGFNLAYLIASLGIIAMVGCYSFSILKSRKGATTIVGAMSALYLYLFSALTSEDYALLTGSLGFTLVLGVVMYLTRHIDWYELTGRKAEVVGVPPIAKPSVSAQSE